MSFLHVPGSPAPRIGPSDTFDLARAGTPEILGRGSTGYVGFAALDLLV